MAPHTTAQPELLTSWKEIANYLGKGVRTVQRWESQFELPVRRPNERVRGVVMATRPDLDRWLEKRWSRRRKDRKRNVVQVNGDQIGKVHANVELSEQLRQASRRLREDFRVSLSNMYAECEALARNMTEVPKAS